jgi:RecB family exonuclease
VLTYLTVESIKDKRALFLSLIPQDAQWIVSDLKSKTYLERERLKKFGFAEGDRVIRARDLWVRITEQYFPEFRIVDECLIEPRLRKFLDDRHALSATAGVDWAQRPNAHKTLLKYMAYLMPILNSPVALPLVREWFTTDEQRLARWGHWFISAAEAWVALESEKLLSSSWLSGFLAHRLPENFNYRDVVDVQTTYFDFGADLLPGEADLILRLAESHAVTVIAPGRAWQKKDPNIFKSYQRLESAAKNRTSRGIIQNDQAEPVANSLDPEREYLRFSSALAEIKDGVARVREWIDAGVPLKSIALLAPDIGLYWPALEPHLRTEGIPTDRPVTTSVQTLPDFQAWLARIKIGTRNFDQVQLEHEWIEMNEKGGLPNYRDFERIYSRYYDDSDLQRNARFAGHVGSLKNISDSKISFADFCDLAGLMWPQSETYFALAAILQQLQDQGASFLRLTFSDWARVTESSSARLEDKIQEGDRDGIACLDINSAEYFGATHIIVFGLSEDALRRQQALHVLDRDISALAAATGFDLPFPETRQLEWELPWLLHRIGSTSEADPREIILSFPETNFDGSPLTPSIFWLKGRLAQSETTDLGHSRRTPMKTRWDELQRLPMAKIGETLGWTPEHNIRFEKAFTREVTKQPLAPWKMDDWKLRLRRFSPSLLQKYADCPFIVLNERIWGQSDLPDLDLDLDPMTRGKLLHRIFEKILESESVPQLTSIQITELVHACMIDVDVQLGEPKLRAATERRIAKVAHEFLQRERSWRELYPETRTIARELSVEGWIDLDTGELSAKPPEGSTIMEFKGQIDRVDEDANHKLLILDYKSSGNGLNSHNLWLKNNQLQLGLYMQSIQQGMTQPPLPSKDIVAAQYYIMKDFSRTKGLVLQGEADQLIRVSQRSKSKMEVGEFEIFSDQLKSYVKALFDRMENGEWIPRPRTEEICTRCQWRGLCRAPHLI